jgi:isoquinoline 1-oxidoreductase
MSAPSRPAAPSIPSDVDRYELSEPRRYVFELERRDFIRLFGAGIVVAVAATETLAQESGRARPQGRADTPDLAAWIHIDERGHANVNTGKVEIGQNIRTSLSQTVADELRVPMASVTLVMADTDETPFDMGTFGSMTTPRMAPQLAKAAATAREMLIDLAAVRWHAERSTLSARDGRIIASDGRALTYAELTKGQTLAGTIASPPLDEPAAWKIRGTAVPKVDGRDFVTGRHQYTPDVTRPRLVYGRIVRPDAFGASLAAVDDARAKAIPGVSVVRDGDFLGVVAPTERDAARAANAVQTRWTTQPGQPSSDTVYDYFKKNADGRQQTPAIESIQIPSGARIFDASYRIPYIAHTPLEPRAASPMRGGRRPSDRHVAPFGVRRARRSVSHSRRPRPRDRARHGIGLRRQAHGGRRDRGGAPRESRRKTGEARVDARRGVHVGVLPSGRRHRHQERRGR